MARFIRILYPEACYDVTCRGNEMKANFLDVQDRPAFFEKFWLSLDDYRVYLLAYVCMPDHFHFLLTTPEGNFAEFMRQFSISYTSAFNPRHKRAGHIFIREDTRPLWWIRTDILLKYNDIFI